MNAHIPCLCRFENAGVTLLELMMVLVVMVVLASLALPGFGRHTARSRLIQEADRLEAVLGQARLAAMDQGCTWRVVFWPAEGRYLAFSDLDGDAELDDQESRDGPHTLYAGVVFGASVTSGPNNSGVPTDGISFVNERVSFSCLGSCNAGTVYLRNAEESLALRLLPASGTITRWVYAQGWQEER